MTQTKSTVRLRVLIPPRTVVAECADRKSFAISCFAMLNESDLDGSTEEPIDLDGFGAADAHVHALQAVS